MKMSHLFLLLLINLFSNAYGLEIYPVGEKQKVKSLPSHFYNRLQATQKDFVDAKSFAPSDLIYLENDKIVYYDYKSKIKKGHRSYDEFEKEIQNLNKSQKNKFALYFEQNLGGKPNQILMLTEVDTFNLELKNLSTGESIKFNKSLNTTVMTLFGEKYGKHRYVNVFRVNTLEAAVMVDGKFYFYLRD